MPVSLLLKVIKEDDIQILEEKCEILEKTVSINEQLEVKKH